VFVADVFKQHCLNFFPLPHEHGAFLPGEDGMVWIVKGNEVVKEIKTAPEGAVSNIAFSKRT
jgi:hypothetical protein